MDMIQTCNLQLIGQILIIIIFFNIRSFETVQYNHHNY